MKNLFRKNVERQRRKKKVETKKKCEKNGRANRMKWMKENELNGKNIKR